MIFDGFLIGFQKLDLHHWPRNEIRIMKFRVWTFSCRPTGWRFLERIFFLLDDVSRFEKNGFRRVLCNLCKRWSSLWSSFCAKQCGVAESNCHSTLSKTNSQKRIVILREAMRSHKNELSFCAKWNGVAESNCRSTLSKTTSQNLIVILWEAKHSRRIYWRTKEGFCNSGQWCSLCRMTRWIDDSEFKDPKFCQIHQLPRLFVFFL